MSKKKDRRIKRLQWFPIWPTVLQMIFTEFAIFVFTSFICMLAALGIINTLIINNAQECRTVVKAVEENWKKDTPEQLEERLSYYTETYRDINKIYLDDHNNVVNLLPQLKQNLDEETLELFDTVGVIHFIDKDYNDDDIEFHVSTDNDRPSDLIRNIIFYNPKNLFKLIHVERFLQDREYISWAEKESFGLHVISVYRTDIPKINLCFRTVYRLNEFQFTLLVTVLFFFIVVLFVSTIYEVTKLIDAVHERSRINKLVTTDTITGGYNKEYFLQKAKKEISRGHRSYAVVQLRLEKYRNYCTAYGLKQGENLLEEINSTLVQMLMKKEFVAHVEKSDFALLLNYQNDEALEIRIRNMMNILREHRGGQHLTFSAGVCHVVARDEDIGVIITCAGLAIPKTVKLQDEIVWFNDSMKEEQVWERRIEDDMEKALENHEFQVFLQPKYSTKKEELSAAEALVRWIHPVLGFVSPGKFIPIFERNGFILQLDDYMLDAVAHLQAAWMSQGKKLVPISVNVSRAHFAEENLAEHICSIVDKFKVPHEYIELELTESAFFDDKAVLLTTVRKLKDFGFKVSMDDFGAGYSSLNSLKELPLDIIKLDAEFFRSVDDIERSNLIVGQTISLAKKLGMEIVAEGIETREQVDFLAKQDCDLIQGFYFSKPLPVAEFEERAYPKE